MNFYAVNPDGTEKWSYPTNYQVFSSPAIGPDGTIYFGSNDNYIYALNPDGTKKWRDTTAWYIFSSPAIGPDGTIYFGSWDTNFYAYNPNGTEKWSYQLGAVEFSSPVIGADGTIYFGDYDNNLYALNPNGTEKWICATNGYIPSSPAIGADGTLYFGDEDGNLYAIKDSQVAPQVTSSNPVNGAINVPSNSVMTITFNEPIEAGSGYNNISMLNTNENSSKDIITSISGNTLTITPTYNWLQFVTYSLTIPANSITDLSGNNLTSNYTTSFTCRDVAVTTPPTVTSIDPANNSTNVPTTKTITITFNEPIQSGTTYNNINVMNTVTNTAQTITKTISGNTLNITSPNNWTQGIEYTVNIPANSITDLSGDNLTNIFTSNFTITNTTGITQPSITSTDPANNTIVPPTKIMTVTFNEPIEAGSGYSNISMLNTNENSSKDIITSISGNTLTITPTYNWLQFVTYILTIPANSITDLSGNSLASDYTTSFTCNNVTDTTPPTVASIDPANNSTNVPTAKAITTTFSEPIQTGTAYNNIEVMNTVTNTAQTITKTISGNTLTITSPNNWTLGTGYTITIPANSITDLSGNGLTNTFTSNFTITNTTGTTPPTITSTDPANNTSTTPTMIMTVTFSEPIQAGSAYSNISMLNTNENSSKDIITSISGNTLTITPTYNWLEFVTYLLTIPANSITDLSGNSLASDYTTSFTIE